MKRCFISGAVYFDVYGPHFMTNRLAIYAVAFATLLLTACSSKPETDDASSVNDPIEGVNRVMWTLNYDYIDPYFLRPVSLAYVDYTPSPLRTGLKNFFSNLDEPSSMVNNLLMGNGGQAMDNLGRFVINTTFGVLGLFDVASYAGLSKIDDRSFGDTLGHYGVGNGPYLMLPAAGPNTVRGLTDTVDSYYFPLVYLNIWGTIGKFMVQGMEARASLVSQESQLNNSPDPYTLTREIYLQHQDFKAQIEQPKENKEEEDYLDSYLDDNF